MREVRLSTSILLPPLDERLRHFFERLVLRQLQEHQAEHSRQGALRLRHQRLHARGRLGSKGGWVVHGLDLQFIGTVDRNIGSS